MSLAYATCLLLQLCDRLPSPMGESAVDCSSLSSLPTVSFTVAGKTFDLSPDEVIIFIKAFLSFSFALNLRAKHIMTEEAHNLDLKCSM